MSPSLLHAYPGREVFISQLTTLLTTTPPQCIHIHTPFSPDTTVSIVRSILSETRSAYAWLHGVECLTPRFVFDRALTDLAEWRVEWNEGCASFGAGKYSTDLGAFVEGLGAVAHAKGAGAKLVLVIERGERFKENLPQLMVPFTKLTELCGVPVTTLFISEVSWFELRPPLGAAYDPFIMEVANLSKQDMISTLVSQFPSHAEDLGETTLYSPAFKPLYAQYIEALYSVCAVFVPDQTQLAYLAAACWPGFISPVLAEWRTTTDPNPPLPSSEMRLSLIRFFTPTFTRALETLYPRFQHAHQWISATALSPELKVSDLGGLRAMQEKDKGVPDGVQGALTTVAKFVLVAAFLASVNPPKRDMRMLGKVMDERGRKRRGGGRRARGGAVRIRPRLAGPMAFPLDRLIAILGALMEEHDSGPRVFGNDANNDEDNMEEENQIEKDTEMAVGRIQVSATISELVAMRLLHRVTPGEKLEGPPTFKCGISQLRAFELARELGVGNLGELMWDDG